MCFQKQSVRSLLFRWLQPKLRQVRQGCWNGDWDGSRHARMQGCHGPHGHHTLVLLGIGGQVPMPRAAAACRAANLLMAIGAA